MRLVKYLSLSLVALIALAVIAVVVLLETTDFDQYRPQIAAEVKAATGRDLEIAGKFHLALSLTPTVSVSDVRFANAPWGSRPDMARLDRLEAEIKLLPLLSGTVAVRQVRLIGADILLETDKAGLGNWLLHPAAAAPSSSAGASGAPPPSIDSLSIEKSVLTFHDGQTGRSQQMKIAAMKTAAAGPAAPLRIDLTGAANGAPFTLAGTAGSLAALFGEQPVAVDLKLTLGGSTIGLVGQIEDPGHAGGLAVDFVAEGKSLADLTPLATVPLPPLGPYRLAAALSEPDRSFRLNRLSGRLGGSDFAGDVRISFAGPRPRIEATLTAERFDAKDVGLIAAASGGGPAGGRLIPDDPLPFDALRQVDGTMKFTGKQVFRAPMVLDNFAFDAKLEGGKLTIGRFSTGLAGGIVTATATADAAAAVPRVELTADARQVEAGALAATLGVTRILSGGRVTLSLALSGAGGNLSAIAAGLDGRAAVEMEPGGIDSTFARLFFADLYKLLSFGSDEATLDCVDADFAIKGGVATSRGLVIDTPAATILGTGSVRLGDETLDLLLTPRAKQAGLTTLAVPVRVRGSLANPSVYPDTMATLANLPDKTIDTAAGIALVPINIFQSLAGMTRTSALAIAKAGNNPCSAALAGGRRASAPATATGVRIIDAPIGAVNDAASALKGLLP
jgi:uncharacterized protein involved in outer membrane biogenesis